MPHQTPNKASIIGLPYDRQSSFMPGAAKAPAAIRKAFHCESTNTFCEAGWDVSWKSGTDHSIDDQGDLDLQTELANHEDGGKAVRDRIEESVRALAKEGKRLLALGGDHAVTFPMLTGLSHVYDSIHVLHLDAHPDLYNELDGNRFSHATPMKRALESGAIQRLTQVGIRTMNAAQQEQVDRYSVKVITMDDWHASSLERTDLDLELNGPVYLSLDLDVLDPAFAPGVSHHEPGGCSTRQLLRLIQSLNVDLIGADIVELNPDRDPTGVTAMVAAKLMKEILAKLVSAE